MGGVKLSGEFQAAWDNVKVVDSKTGQESYIMPDAEEMALQYVAATRAEKLLVHRGLISKVEEHLKKASSSRIANGPIVA